MSRIAQGTNNESINVDRVQLTGISMVNFPTDNRGVKLLYETGYESGGEFVTVHEKELRVSAQEFAAFATSQPDVSGGFYAALKDWCYQQIAAAAGA